MTSLHFDFLNELLLRLGENQNFIYIKKKTDFTIERTKCAQKDKEILNTMAKKLHERSSAVIISINFMFNKTQAHTIEQ